MIQNSIIWAKNWQTTLEQSQQCYITNYIAKLLTLFYYYSALQCPALKV